MTGFVQQCVDSYKELCEDPRMALKHVETPFLASAAPDDILGDCGHATPPDEVPEKEGVLQQVACSVLMKVLYGARVARWHLLKAVNRLAARVSKWTSGGDK